MIKMRVRTQNDNNHDENAKSDSGTEQTERYF